MHICWWIKMSIIFQELNTTCCWTLIYPSSLSSFSNITLPNHLQTTFTIFLDKVTSVLLIVPLPSIAPRWTHPTSLAALPGKISRLRNWWFWGLWEISIWSWKIHPAFDEFYMILPWIVPPIHCETLSLIHFLAQELISVTSWSLADPPFEHENTVCFGCSSMRGVSKSRNRQCL